MHVLSLQVRKLRRYDYDSIICSAFHALLDFQVPAQSKLNAGQNKHWMLQQLINMPTLRKYTYLKWKDVSLYSWGTQNTIACFRLTLSYFATGSVHDLISGL